MATDNDQRLYDSQAAVALRLTRNYREQSRSDARELSQAAADPTLDSRVRTALRARAETEIIHSRRYSNLASWLERHFLSLADQPILFADGGVYVHEEETSDGDSRD